MESEYTLCKLVKGRVEGLLPLFLVTRMQGTQREIQIMEFFLVEMNPLDAYALNGGTKVEEVLLGQFGNLCHDTAELLNLLMKETDFLGFSEECHLFDTTATQATEAMVAK